MMKIKMKRLTGDVAVVVGAVVVLQEGDQSVQEVMWTQENKFLQHVYGKQEIKQTSQTHDNRPSSVREKHI